MTITTDTEADTDWVDLVVPTAPAAAVSFNAEQSAALDDLRVFLKSKDRFFVLVGFAGTGKTFIVQQFLYEQVTLWKRRVAVVAPTNKAVRVLIEMGLSFGHGFFAKLTYGTMHQLLGLRMKVDEVTGKVDFVPDYDNPFVSDPFDIIVCDEASMLNTELFTLVSEGIRKTTKIVFIGDPCQLPPVGEDHSPVFGIERGARLTEIMRHGGAISELVTAVRRSITDGGSLPNITHNHDGEDGQDASEGVWYAYRPEWLKGMLRDFTSDRFKADSNYVRALAWTNRVVKWGNDMVHEAIYGKNAPYFLPGQRLVAADPVIDTGDTAIMTTSAECTVKNAIKTEHAGYKSWLLTVELDTGVWREVRCVDREDREEFETECLRMMEKAKSTRSGWSKKMAWKDYFAFKGMFANLDYVYFLTVHKSQGSTFERVYVALGDIRANKNKEEMKRCVYTAFTRASKRLVIQER